MFRSSLPRHPAHVRWRQRSRRVFPYAQFVPVALIASLLGAPASQAETAAARAPLRESTLTPAYPIPHDPMPAARIRAILERVFAYLDDATPAALVDRSTGRPINDYTQPHPDAVLAPADFQLTNYQWGVTYAGMLNAAEVTGDSRYETYVTTRLLFMARAAPLFRNEAGAAPGSGARATPFRAVNAPHSLDDAGAMAAAMIKAVRAGIGAEALRPYIDRYLAWVTTGQKRLADGTFAREQPMPGAVWLDDLYMSLPALAQMGALTGDRRYFDDATRQLVQFHRRMFVPEKHLWMHGWVEGMDPHPAFHWARANGWAIMAVAELLSVLPEDHPQRAAVLSIYRDHARGLAACQGRDGLWHQLLDRPDSYAETSASAMAVFALARGINRGWLQRAAYEPAVRLGWNAVAAQVNEKGQVENTCIGTGMAFEPMFYYYRPVSPLAAHGYGPVLLAGSEMLQLYRP